MPEFYFGVSIGGTNIVKVEADTKDAAMEAAAQMAIDDFENAGSLKIGDVLIEEFEIDDLGRILGGAEGDVIIADTFDNSIIAVPSAAMNYPRVGYEEAPDDPNYECPDCGSFTNSGDSHNDGCPRLEAPDGETLPTDREETRLA